MELPFASQHPLVRFWAILSAALLAVLLVLAGVSVLATERMVEEWDTEAPRLAGTFIALGLPGLLSVWLLHLASLVVLLGYRRNASRQFLSIAVFAACAGYAGLAALAWPSLISSMCFFSTW